MKRQRRDISSTSANSIGKFLPPQVREVIGTARDIYNTGRELYTTTKDTVNTLKSIGEYFISSGSTPSSSGKMVRRRQRNRRRRQRQNRRPTNFYLRPVRLPIKIVVPWSKFKGTKEKWNYHLSLDSIIKPFATTYDEFKCTRLRINYMCANPSSDTGNYVGICMDQNGFGDYGTATSEAWFESLASFPGSRVQHTSRGCVLNWYSTEPSSKEWRTAKEAKDYIVCSIYFAHTDATATELGGTTIITGTILARGRYYNVPTVDRLIHHGIHIQPPPTDAISEEFNNFTIVSAQGSPDGLT